MIHPIDLSVVSPFFNERELLPAFCTELRGVLDGLDLEYEVVLVDDGSTDGSFDTITRLAWPQCTVVRLQANAGHQTALDVGVRHTRGEFVVTMDSDLQHPPALIPTLVHEARSSGADVVYALRVQREDDRAFKRHTARLYYRIMRSLTGVPIQNNAADYRLMTRFVVDVLNAIPERKVFRLLIPALGFTSASVAYESSPRQLGASKYTFGKMLGLAVRSSVQFSRHPLRVVAYLGLFTSAVAAAWLVYVFATFFAGTALTGWTSVMAVVLLLGGTTLFSLGVIGEYVGEIYEATKGRPPYIIRTTQRLDDSKEPGTNLDD